MAELVLFHHVQGLTDGLHAFADQLREAGHVVHTPDLLDGARPATLEEGIALVQSLGAEGSERADRAVADLPAEVVYAGFSWGVLAAQRLAQTRPGAELFTYPGDQHLFADSSLPSYDADAAALLFSRTNEFLDRLG